MEKFRPKGVDAVFITEIIFFILFVLGILPRSLVNYFVIFLAAYAVLAKTEDSTIFFVRSIPFFIAIPLTQTFDNLNTWRILSVLIFLKWYILKFKSLNIKYFIPKNKPSVLLGIILLLAVASIIPAADKVVAIKRIIYFVNLIIEYIAWYSEAKSDSNNARLRLHQQFLRDYKW